MADTALVILVVGHAGKQGQGCDAQFIQFFQYRINMTVVAVENMGLVQDQTHDAEALFRRPAAQGFAFFRGKDAAGGIKALFQRRYGLSGGTVHAKVDCGNVTEHGCQILFISIPEILPDVLILAFLQAGTGQQFCHLLRQGGFKVDGHPGRKLLPDLVKIGQGLGAAMEINNTEIALLGHSQHIRDFVRMAAQIPDGPAASAHESRIGFLHPAECPLHIKEPIFCCNQA